LIAVLVVLICVAAVVVGVVVSSRSSVEFERRHGGFVSGRSEASVSDVFEHRRKRIDVYWKECHGILLRLYSESGAGVLGLGSYWRRARRDLLKLYSSAVSSADGLMRWRNQPISQTLLRIKIAISRRQAICQSCLDRNRRRIAKDLRPICFLAEGLERVSADNDGGEGNAFGGSLEIGSDGDLRIQAPTERRAANE
jgi:hypothetical protein